MLFFEIEFLIFFLVVLTLLLFVKKTGNQKNLSFLILTSSYVFYAFNGIIPLLIISLIILIGYIQSIFLSRQKIKYIKIVLIGCVGTTLLPLAYYKYSLFILDELLRIEHGLNKNLIIPVGLSFYTFQAISYQIDVARQRLKPRNILDFAAYITFFPQLVAGPIVRPDTYFRQIDNFDCIKPIAYIEAIYIFSVGFFLKIWFADYFGSIIDQMATQTAALNLGEKLLFSQYFSVQIYCDFCGYSMMAIGISKLMGIDLPKNFKFPYFAPNPQEFWRRWHVSLSSFFRDYVYIPLNNGRASNLRTSFALVVVFLLSGIWHGANWGFLIWGVCHAIVILGYINVKRLYNFHIPMVLCIFLTYGIMSVLWVPFRISDVTELIDFLYINDFNIVPQRYREGLIILPIFLTFEVIRYKFESKFTNVEFLIIACVLSYFAATELILRGNNTEFIYFAF